METSKIENPKLTRAERLSAGKMEALGGRLVLDRPLPFLCLYWQPKGKPDRATVRFVTTQAAYLIVSEEADPEGVTAGIAELASAMRKRFGGFMLVEVWSTPAPGAGVEGDPESLRPQFHLHLPKEALVEVEPVVTLAKALKRIQLRDQMAEVKVQCHEEKGRVGSLVAPPFEASAEAVHVGLEIAPVYRAADTGEVYPFFFEALRAEVGTALKETFFSFACTQTSLRPAHPYALGPRRMSEAAVEIDAALADLDASFGFLLQVTPVNTAVARGRFLESGGEEEPLFQYRPLPVDPERIKRRLFSLPLERVEDPALASIFREKQEELDRRITMLRDRGSRRFFFGSLQLYGEVKPALLALAHEMLDRLPLHDYDYESEQHFDAGAFASIASTEFSHYREGAPDFPHTAQLRADLPGGLMVSQGQLLIGKDSRIPVVRAEALLQHEVGTHMVTYFNGKAQPLQLLRTGLAGYEALQEGLAVLAEYLVGGLNIPRLRVLAARVVAAHCLIEGATFVDVFRQLRHTYGFEPALAFTVAMRVFRGGGFIKDVIYLRGLHELILYLRDGGELEPLLVGKMALHHVPTLHELTLRGVVKPPRLTPRYLTLPETEPRLARIRSGLTFIDLFKPTA